MNKTFLKKNVLNTMFRLFKLISSVIIILILLALVYPEILMFASSSPPQAVRHDWKAWEGWQFPECRQISGVTMFAVTQNGGDKILFPKSENDTSIVSSNKYFSNRSTNNITEKSGSLSSVTPLHTPNTLLANYSEELVISKDAGCTWSVIKNIKTGAIKATANGGAYVISDGVRDMLKKYPPSLVYLKDNQTTKLSSPFVITISFAIDPVNPQHLRAAGEQPLDRNGNIVKLPVPQNISGNSNGGEKFDTRAIADSMDGGRSWTITNRFPFESRYNRIYINPQNINHLIYPDGNDKSLISFDSGKSWQKSTLKFISPCFSPVDPNIIWAYGAGQTDKISSSSFTNTNVRSSGVNTAPNMNRGISNIRREEINQSGEGLYFSRDGGRSFTLELKNSDDTASLNIAEFYPHPADPDLIYYIRGVTLTKYNRRDHSSTTRQIIYPGKNKDPEIPEAFLEDMVFSPADSSIIYLSFRKNTPIN